MPGPNEGPTERPSTAALFAAFLRLGATAFGGPATVAPMHRAVVRDRAWLSDADFGRGLALCQMIPGATAMQSAAYVGFRLRGLPGAMVTFVGFGLPAFGLMLLASAAYARALTLPSADRVFAGLRVAVVAIVASATLDFGRSHVKAAGHAILVLAVALLLLVGCAPVWTVLLSMGVGALGRPDQAPATTAVEASGLRNYLRRSAVLGLLIGLIAAALLIAPAPLAELAATMARIDLTAFGGGFAALPLMMDELVSRRGMLSASAFMDGVALGQITPGPVVITATFVGFHIAHWAGAVAATVGVFLPSFVLIVATAPWFDRMQRHDRIRRATQAAALSFVGLLFVTTYRMGREIPWSWTDAVLAAACLLALRKRFHVIAVMSVAAVAEAVVARFG